MTFFGRTIAWYLIAFAAPPRLPRGNRSRGASVARVARVALLGPRLAGPAARRPQACEALRERCLARVRLGREAGRPNGAASKEQDAGPRGSRGFGWMCWWTFFFLFLFGSQFGLVVSSSFSF